MGDSVSRAGGAVLAAAVAALAALASGCAGKGPAQAAQNYLDNLKLHNYPACYRMLSRQDRAGRTMEQFLAGPPLAPEVSRDWFKAVLGVVNYEIGAVRRAENNQTVVAVRVTQPDLPLWERTVDATVDPGASPDRAAQKTLSDGSYPKLAYDDEIVTVKEAGGWRILVDFPAREEAEKKHKEAIRAYHRRDYAKTIAAYQAALADLGKEGATGSAGLKFLYQRELGEIEKVQNQLPETQAYVPKLALTDVDMKMTASRAAGIFGKIRNAGNRAVDEVVCTVTYYVGQGKRRTALYSEEHTIIATPLEFANFSRPVLPFVPGESRDFGFRLAAPTEIQQKAAPGLAITALAFTQSAAPVPKLSPSPVIPPSTAQAPAGSLGGASPAATSATAPPAPH